MVICIRDYVTSAFRYTAGKTYQFMDDNSDTIVIIDDYGCLIALTKEYIIGIGFPYHFKYLSEIRDNKLKQLGI
jgi:hypothetical protein